MILKGRKRAPINTSNFEEAKVDSDMEKLYPEIMSVAYIPPRKRSVEGLKKETRKSLSSIITKELLEEGEVIDSKML